MIGPAVPQALPAFFLIVMFGSRRWFRSRGRSKTTAQKPANFPANFFWTETEHHGEKHLAGRFFDPPVGTEANKKTALLQTLVLDNVRKDQKRRDAC
jgi:hypothetical protein